MQDSPRSLVASSLFSRLLQSADLRSGALPSLRVVDDAAPNAFAMPSGEILVTTGLLDVCYEDTADDPALGDARLALVLGHELAHVALDRGHRALFAARRFGSSQAEESLAHAEDESSLAMEERRADYYGLQYFLRAGFDGDLLVQDGTAFWDRMDELMRAGGQNERSRIHPPPGERAELVRTQLVGLAMVADLFHWGTRLLQLGELDEAILLLEHYQLSYAGREVLNNLGVAYARLASAALADCDGQLVVRDYLPLMTDSDTLYSRARLRGGERSPCYSAPAFTGPYRRARLAFEKSAEMSPDYLPAHFNLASLLLLGDSASQAYGPIYSAHDLTGGQDPLVESLFALALYRVGKENGIDQAGETLAKLDEIATAHAGLAAPHFHSARILQELGRTDDAMTRWLGFLERESEGPWADLARELTTGKALARDPAPPSCKLRKLSSARPDLPGPGSPRAAARRYDLGGRSFLSWRYGNARGLVVDGRAALLEVEAEEVPCDTPHRDDPVRGGRLRRFADGFQELRRDGSVVEVRELPPGDTTLPGLLLSLHK